MRKQGIARNLTALFGTIWLAMGPADAIRIRLWPAGVAPFSVTRDSTDLWPGYRSVILLPAKNEAQGGANLAKAADEEFRAHLKASRKFSLEDVHPRSPIFIRAKSENLMREEDVLRWQQQHLIEDAFALGSTIGVQAVGELKVAGYEVQDLGGNNRALKVTVIGILHDVKTRQKEREVVASAVMAIPRQKPDATALERSALRSAIGKVVDAFVGRPITDNTPKPKVTKPNQSPKPTPPKPSPVANPPGSGAAPAPKPPAFPPDPDM